MKGDFSRWPFNPNNHFTRVLMQQGRVQLDADWNEQIAILLHTMRQMVSDMMGPHGTWDNNAFEARKVESDYQVNLTGRYYAGGMLVDTTNEGEKWTKVDGVGTSGNTLIYLDAWERHLTYVEADETNQPGLREVALKGADTTTRAKIAWRVRTGAVPSKVDVIGMKTSQDNLKTWPGDLKAKEDELITEANSTAIESGFSGLADLETDLEEQIESLVRNLNMFVKSTSDSIPDQLTELSGNSKVEHLFTQLNALLSDLKPVLDNSANKPDPPISVPDTSGHTASEDTKIQKLITRMNLIVDIQKLKIDIERATETLNSEIIDIEKNTFDNTRGQLKATTQEDNNSNTETDSCTIPPDAAYTGPENQLYRVEIHNGGDATEATFKWSRENGTVIFPINPDNITRSDGEVTVEVMDFGRDTEARLALDGWVELTYDELAEQLEPGYMLQVTNVDTVTGMVTLKGNSEPVLPDTIEHPILRRWESNEQPTIREIIEGDWFKLEKQIQVQFETGSHQYRTGDYWLIPARTATRDIEWPQEFDDTDKKWKPKFEPPHGIQHYYAPLAIISSDGTVIDCRRVFEQLGRPVLPE